MVCVRPSITVLASAAHKPRARLAARWRESNIQHTYSNVSGILQNTGSEVMVRLSCTATAR